MPSSAPAPISPSGRVAIPVAHGQLEAILREPEAAVAVAVVCHPHPRGGGTMNNNVVYRVAKALVARRRRGAAFQLPRRRRVDRELRGRHRRRGRRARRAGVRARLLPDATVVDGGLLVRGARRSDRGRRQPRRRTVAGRRPGASHVRLRLSRAVRQAQGDRASVRRRVRRPRRDRGGGQRHGGAEAAVGRRRRHAPVPRTPRPVRSRGVGSRRWLQSRRSD